MQYGILGPLEVLDRGRPVAVRGTRQRTLLARLLLDPRRVVTVDRLVEDVWDGRPPGTAHKALQKYVSELRRSLGASSVRTVAAGYAMDVADEALDACRFEQLVATGDLDAALALWRGDVLADLPDVAFAEPERTRLGELRLFALEARLEARLARGEHAEIVGQVADLADGHPLRERLTSLHMLALYRSGRQVEALRTFDRHRRRLADEVGVAPAAELRDLHAAILRHDPSLDLGPSAPRPRAGRALPRPLTSLVGRADELTATARAVGTHRLVTITGPGGVGKTRLAVELGLELGTGRAGGVWAVDLAVVRSADRVADAVAGVLGVDVRQAPDDLTALTVALAHRPPCLLMLDNCEHVVEAVAALVTAVLHACPDVKVLATSRRPLGVDGEFVRPLQPLAEGDALRLFTDRAALAGVDLDPDDAGPEVEELCRRLDGLPLAIELAASQLRAMSPAELASRLQDQLRFRGPAVAPPARQRTLRDMIRWSYDLIPPPAQRCFDRLGVFVGSITLDAAEAVGAGTPEERRDVLLHVTALVDHSLLVRDLSREPPTRYRVLETLRLFALEQLGVAGELHSARRAHAAFFRRLADEAGRHLYGPDELAWRKRLQVDEPNFHAALAWTGEHDPTLALRLAVALWPYWDVRWGERHAVAYLEELLGRPDLDVPDDARAWGLTVAADLAANPGEARRSVPWATAAVAAFRRIGDEYGLAQALVALGSALGNEGALDEADAALAEALAAARRRDDPVLVPRALNYLSFVATRRGDYQQAAALSRDELVAWMRLDSRRGEATALRHLAVAILRLGDLDEADELCRRALELWRALGDPSSIAHVQTTLADIARMRGDLADAAEQYRTALDELQAIGDRRCTASTFKNLGMVAAGRNEHTHSVELFQRGLELRHELGDEAGLAECLEGLAGAWTAQGEHDRAAVLLGAAAERRHHAGNVADHAEAEVIAGLTAAGRRTLGDERFGRCYRSGRELTVADVVDAALAPGPT